MSNKDVLHFHHIGVAVADEGKAVHFLASIGYQCHERVYDPLQHVNLIWCEHPLMPAIELISAAAEDSPIDNLLKLHDGITYHIGFTCSDLVATLEEIKAVHRVISTSPPKEAILFANSPVCFYHISGFGLIEIIEDKHPKRSSEEPDQSFATIHQIAAQAESSQLPELNITILRNITLEPLEPFLQFHAFKMGLKSRIHWGQYDRIFQETVGESPGLFGEKTDLVLVFLKLEALSWKLANNFNALNAEEIQQETGRIKDLLNQAHAGIRRQTSVPIIWHSFEMPIYPALGILDGLQENGQTTMIRELNDTLVSISRADRNTFPMDLNRIMARIGYANYFDPRYWHIAKAPYQRQALAEIAADVFSLIRTIILKNKKCLVLDCDNILWGGVIGEDGIDHVQLGNTYPGSIYLEFQQEILNLYHRGVIIALCSKNNETDVWEVFRKHPDMLLKEVHIAAAKINWLDKATNLRQLAEDLRIGLDSMVFVDDNEFEINYVKQAIPEIDIIHIPPDKMIRGKMLLEKSGYFNSFNFSAEDRERGKMYQEEIKRNRFKTKSTTLDEYLFSLQMIAEIKHADNFTVPRIAQLTQRTNQFNLTTRRYTEKDIASLSEQSETDVLYLRLKDIFGDSGIVGVCILKYKNQQAILDTFLLSCRVLGRRIEDLLLKSALDYAKKRNSTDFLAQYIPTGKNGQTATFFPDRGFAKTRMPDSSAGEWYRLDLQNGWKTDLSIFKQIINDINASEADYAVRKNI